MEKSEQDVLNEAFENLIDQPSISNKLNNDLGIVEAYTALFEFSRNHLRSNYKITTGNIALARALGNQLKKLKKNKSKSFDDSQSLKEEILNGFKKLVNSNC